MAVPYPAPLFRADAIVSPVPSLRSISLSSSGLVTDAVLEMWSTTYGSDQTAAAQAILDKALDGKPLQIVWDVRMSCTGLRIPSGVTILAFPGCGAILRKGSNKPLLTNNQPYLRPTGSRNSVVPRASYSGTVPAGVTPDGLDEINVVGGIWNCNGWNLDKASAQYPQDTAPANPYSVVWEGSNQSHHTTQEGWIHGVRFTGVRGSFSGTILNSRCFAFYIADFRDFLIDGLLITQQRKQRPEISGNTDGLHIGRGERLRVRNYRCRWSGDDFFAIVNAQVIDQLFSQSEASAYEAYPFAGPGLTSDVTGEGITGESCKFGLRVLSGQAGPNPGGARIEGVRLKGIRGNIVDGGKWLSCQQYTGGNSGNPLTGPGNTGDVLLEDVYITGGSPGELGQCVELLKIHNMQWDNAGPLLTTQNEATGMVTGTVELSSIRATRTGGDARGLVHHAVGTIGRIRLRDIDTTGIDALVSTAGSASLGRVIAAATSQAGSSTRILLHNSSSAVTRLTDRGCEYTEASAGSGTITTHDADRQGSDVPPPTPGTYTLIAQDDFSGSSTSTIAGRVPTPMQPGSATWTDSTGNWDVGSGSVTSEGEAGYSTPGTASLLDIGQTYDKAVIAYTLTTGFFQPHLFQDNAGNYIAVNMNATSNEYTIYAVPASGSATQVGAVIAAGITGSRTLTVIRTAADTLTVAIDGGSQTTHTHTTTLGTGTKIGLGSSAAGVVVSDVAVYKVVA